MTYRIVYDLAQQPPFEKEVAYIAAAFIVTGTVWALIWRAKDRRQVPPRERPKWTTPKVLVLFGSAIAVIGVGLMSWDHWRLMRAIRNGEARVVEGPVQSWGTERVRTANTKKYEYNTYERFYVGDSIWFGFYREVGMAGFHNGASTLVDLHDGLPVRATYLYADGTDDPPRIVKLEIADTSGTPYP